MAKKKEGSSKSGEPVEMEYFTEVKLDYPIFPVQRWEGAHPILDQIIEDGGIMFYQEGLDAMVNNYYDDLKRIDFWDNQFFSGLDGVVLYSMIRAIKPAYYLEIGSGFSTMFAHRAIMDENLNTRIISIDPQPRAEIEELCFEVIKAPFEFVDINDLVKLNAMDIFFIDGSHRVFQNSDVVAFMFDIMPRLKSGVIVQVHDICLPWDYPVDWKMRFYSEQYMLGAWLMGGHKGWDIIMPNAYMTGHNRVPEKLKEFGNFGGSFWMKKRTV